MAKVLAIANQKGGVGKTTTAFNISAGLALKNYKVLVIDTDPQGNLSTCLGVREPDHLDVTLSDILTGLAEGKDISKLNEIYINSAEGIDYVAGNITLSGVENNLLNVMSRERILKDYVDRVKEDYDYVIIDCSPSLGILTINALMASDSVIIPCQAHYLSIKGLEQLTKTISQVRRHLNPDLYIEGILLTMVDNRSKFTKDIVKVIRENYEGHVNVFNSEIPLTVRATESTMEGKSLFLHDKNNKATTAYRELVKEVIDNNGINRNAKKVKGVER